MNTVNLTPTRILLLKLLAARGEYLIADIANEIAPRNTVNGWSKQAAARWGASYIRPLEAAGLVKVNRAVTSGVGLARITEKGLAMIVD